jgi:D-alanyl-D-alanine carboxypeptidase
MNRLRRVLLTVSLLTTIAALSAVVPASSAVSKRTTIADLQRGLNRLVAAKEGPVGAILTLYRNGRTTVVSAGRANAARPGAPRLNDHMRIASVAKAFNGAVTLHLVQQRRLRLNQTIGKLLPGIPAKWSKVTVREMLNHTSGLPDYTMSDGFFEHVTTDPQGYVTPATVISWVRKKDLEFTPGSRYKYSNTDNIVVGLIDERVAHNSYGRLLSTIVFRPARLSQTTFPTLRLMLPRPFIHGYRVAAGKKPVDVTTSLSPSGAWASGAIVSTPANLGAFIRADLGGRFFGSAQRRQQMKFVPGSSSPPGPGVNSAGLALFRYRTRCGTVYGHTGNFPGYTQWVAATANGKRSVTTSLNIAAPTGKLLAQLRSLQASAVCALMGK